MVNKMKRRRNGGGGAKNLSDILVSRNTVIARKVTVLAILVAFVDNNVVQVGSKLPFPENRTDRLDIDSICNGYTRCGEEILDGVAPGLV
jgi:hypothetical protein